MQQLVAMLLQFVMWVGGIVIKGVDMRDETKRKFYDFLEDASKDQVLSAKTYDEAKSQKARLDAKILIEKEMDKKNKRNN